LALGGQGGDVEVGSAIQSNGRIALGVVHGGRVAAVALLTSDVSAVRFVDLGPIGGDAPPPRIAWRGPEGKDLVAVAPLRGAPGAGLSVMGLGSDGDSKLLFRMQDVPEDSAVDVASSGDRGIVVWEATAAKGTRGVVRAGMFEGAGRAGPTVELSSADSDAEGPRVVASRSGYFVVWAARAIEPLAVTEGSAGAEDAAELRGPRWLEAVVLDGRGAPIGPPKRLTPATSHVGSFDLMLDPAGAVLHVAARDDGASTAGGAAMELLRVRADGTSDPPTTMPADGLGAGAPNFVAGAQPWLAWAGPHEQVVMLPIGDTSSGTPSNEDSFDDSQPLLTIAEGKVLAVAPATAAGAAAQLRVFSCSR
jgi:hypothetical protein